MWRGSMQYIQNRQFIFKIDRSTSFEWIVHNCVELSKNLIFLLFYPISLSFQFSKHVCIILQTRRHITPTFTTLFRPFPALFHRSICCLLTFTVFLIQLTFPVEARAFESWRATVGHRRSMPFSRAFRRRIRFGRYFICVFTLTSFRKFRV